MHPILATRSHLYTYLAAWAPGSALLAILLAVSGEVPISHALALAVPLGLVYSFMCLASWYPCQAAPATAEGAVRMLVTHAMAALFSSSLWIAVAAGWSTILDRAGLPGIQEEMRAQVPLLFAVGLLLYSLTVAIHYLLIAFESSRQTESHNLQLRIKTREAELEALEARRDQEMAEKELALARSIQRRLLPPSDIEGEGYRLAARQRAAQYVAGDFYDIFRLADDRLGLVVADVAGKGVGASLIMASVKAVLPLLAADCSVVETLARLNRKLVNELEAREFVALALARFDPGSGELEVANSGLPDPYLLRPADPPRALEVPGPRLPLGVRTEISYQHLRLVLEPGDRLLLLTDGLPEALTENGEPLGYEALERLMTHSVERPGAWLDELFERVARSTAAGLDDDLTALVLELPSETGSVRTVGLPAGGS